MFVGVVVNLNAWAGRLDRYLRCTCGYIKLVVDLSNQIYCVDRLIFMCLSTFEIKVEDQSCDSGERRISCINLSGIYDKRGTFRVCLVFFYDGQS